MLRRSTRTTTGANKQHQELISQTPSPVPPPREQVHVRAKREHKARKNAAQNKRQTKKRTDGRKLHDQSEVFTGPWQVLPAADSLRNFDTATEIDAAIQLCYETTGSELHGDLLSGTLAEANQGHEDYVDITALRTQLESMILTPEAALQLAEKYAAASVRDRQVEVCSACGEEAYDLFCTLVPVKDLQLLKLSPAKLETYQNMGPRLQAMFSVYIDTNTGFHYHLHREMMQQPPSVDAGLDNPCVAPICSFCRSFVFPPPSTRKNTKAKDATLPPYSLANGHDYGNNWPEDINSDDLSLDEEQSLAQVTLIAQPVNLSPSGNNKTFHGHCISFYNDSRHVFPAVAQTLLPNMDASTTLKALFVGIDKNTRENIKNLNTRFMEQSLSYAH